MSQNNSPQQLSISHATAWTLIRAAQQYILHLESHEAALKQLVSPPDMQTLHDFMQSEKRNAASVLSALSSFETGKHINIELQNE